MKLHRYWLRFDVPKDNVLRYLSFGCGVTAPDLNTALEIVRKRLFNSQLLPPLIEVIEDIDISTLDEDHVLPNMGSPANYGIWFPIGL